MPERSCKERIEENLERELSKLEIHKECPECEGVGCDHCEGTGENPEATRAEDALSVIKRYVVYDVLLSWGGPEDGFRIYWDGEDWVGGEYYFKDWFDGATRPIDVETAQRIAEVYDVYTGENG